MAGRFFPEIDADTIEKILVTFYIHKRGWTSHLFVKAAAQHQQNSSSSSADVVRELCASSHRAGSECTCFKQSKPVLGPYAAQLAQVHHDASYAGPPELSLSRIQDPSKELKPYRPRDNSEFYVVLVVKVGWAAWLAALLAAWLQLYHAGCGPHPRTQASHAMTCAHHH